jgi:hypothetical protein
MKSHILAGAMTLVLVMPALVMPALAADDAGITRMALCRDSWVDWTKNDPKSFDAFRNHVTGLFAPHDNDPYWLPRPKTRVSVLGLHVAQLFPASVGMGVGFSLTVDATYAGARKALEKAMGKPLQHCEDSDGMKACEFAVAPQRTVTLMAADDPKSRQSLIGCYYFYEK